MVKRSIVRLPGAVLFVLLVTSILQAQSATISEQYLISAINRERVSRNLPALRLDVALVMAARSHAKVMAEHRSISHRFADEPELSKRGLASGAHFDRITENVAEGPSAIVLHDAWMQSPGHRANILDPGVDAVGIAVMAVQGQLYAVEDFQSTVQILTLEQQEGAVALLLDRAGLKLVPDARARKTCAMTSGYAGERQPAFIVRYTTGDLLTLPYQLKQRLELTLDHHASIGACMAHDTGAFSSYRIAVLLFE